MSKTALFLCVFQITFLVLISSGGADEPLQVQQVKKWHHLLNQKEIKGKGFTARLGINTATVAAGDGLILYCITDGFDPGSTTKSQTIGPFTYRMQYDREHRLFHSLESLALGPKVDYSKCTLVFRQVIPFTRTGRATIKIFGPDKVNPLAVAKVNVVDDNFHRWIPFVPSQELHALRKAERYDATGYVTIKPNRSAVPVFSTQRPLIFQSIDKTGKAKTHLNPMAFVPTLAPLQGKLRIKQVEEGIAVDSKEKLILNTPESRFLARWWINGKPFIPTANGKQYAEEMTGKIVTGKKYLLACDMTPEHFGGKSTDKLEVQILYSRNGWKDNHEIEKLSLFSPNEGNDLLLSNRIEIEHQK